jgi:hypothetical protein
MKPCAFDVLFTTSAQLDNLTLAAKLFSMTLEGSREGGERKTFHQIK